MIGSHEEGFIVSVQVPDTMTTEQIRREIENSIEFGSVSVTPMYILYPADYFKDDPS